MRRHALNGHGISPNRRRDPTGAAGTVITPTRRYAPIQVQSLQIKGLEAVQVFQERPSYAAWAAGSEKLYTCLLP